MLAAVLVMLGGEDPQFSGGGQPVIERFHFEDSFTDDVCDFTLEVAQVFDGITQLFFDSHSTPTRLIAHVNGTETITNVATGLSITNNINDNEVVVFDDQTPQVASRGSCSKTSFPHSWLAVASSLTGFVRVARL